MPIIYNEAADTWEGVDLTDAERTSLIRSATNSIIEYFGEEVAKNILNAAKGISLKDIPQDQMGTA